MWTDAARAASAATRAANAAKRAQQNSAKNRTKQMAQDALAQKYPNGQGKPGPQTAAHPNPANRAAFALRNKMIHDAGAPARIRAAHQAKLLAATGGVARAAGAGLLGALLGLGGKIVGDALRNQGGRGYRR